MRFAARLAPVVLLAVSLAGCDKAQIAQLQSQTVTVSMTATNTDAWLFNVWDLIDDVNKDNVPDDGMVHLFCESVPVTIGQPPRKIPVVAPWQYSLRVSVLRADSNEFEQISDDIYLNQFSNLTPYDDQVLFGGNTARKDDLPITDTVGSTCSVTMTQACAVDADCPGTETCPPTTHLYRWTNARQMTALHRSVVLATSNPLSDRDLGTYGFRNGLCSVSTDPGPASLAGAPGAFTFELGKGETIKVEARKAVGAPQGLIDDSIPAGPLTTTEPALSAQFTVDGITVTSVGGNTGSETVPGAGLSFFYSSR